VQREEDAELETMFCVWWFNTAYPTYGYGVLKVQGGYGVFIFMDTAYPRLQFLASLVSVVKTKPKLSIDDDGILDALSLDSSIMGEPLSPNHVFDFLVDELEPHPTYDFFAPRPLPGYAGNPNNNNGWIEADMSLLRELGVVVNELMVGPIVDEIAEPIVEAKEQIVDPTP
ncbi:hypothetical protein Tco_0215959, partial [Tanacetum coccineum]